MKSLIILAAATLVAAAANAQATTPPSITELEGDYIIINNRTYEEVPAVYNMRPMTITADGDSLVISNMYMTGCLDIKAGYDETTGDITFPSGKLIFQVGDFVYYLYQWNDDQEAVNPRPFTYRYTGDGEWHFAITDLTTDTDAGSGPWTDALMINWFRFDFANNYTAEDPAYSVDLAYIAMFESEEDAQAYAEEDGGATFPGADDNDDQQGGEDEGKDEPTPPQTGDISVIVAVAAAALVLTILLKKRLAV